MIHVCFVCNEDIEQDDNYAFIGFHSDGDAVGAMPMHAWCLRVAAGDEFTDAWCEEIKEARKGEKHGMPIDFHMLVDRPPKPKPPTIKKTKY